MTGLTTSRGEPIGAVYGFTNMLLRLIDEYDPKYVVATFDVHAPTFRHKLTDKYKATRKPMPPDLAVQLDVLKNLLDTFGIKRYELAGYEADDLIGTIARSPVFTYVLTGDRDGLQLVSQDTHVLLTKKGITDLLECSPENVSTVFGVPADKIVDFKALAGDSSDNIPGVAGIGDKSAVDLLNTFGSLDEIYLHLDEIKGAKRTKLADGKDDAYLSQKLARIDCNVPLDFKLDDCILSRPYPHAAKELIERYEFKSLLRRPELFVPSETENQTQPTIEVKTRKIESFEDLNDIMPILNAETVAMLPAQDGIHIATSEHQDFHVLFADNLLSKLTPAIVLETLSPILKNKHVLSFDLKSLLHAVAPYEITSADDVALMAYLLEYRIQPTTAAELFSSFKECLDELKSRKMTELYYDIELPLVRVLFDMEMQGITIDVSKLDEIGAKFSDLEQRAAENILNLAGRPFNLNSPKQLATILFEELKIPYPGKPPYSTKAEILEQLVGEHPIIDEILKFRFYAKLRATFIEGLHKTVRADNTVHTSFNQMTTTTGRLSSTDPNLQNIPTRTDEGKLLRSLFVPRENNVLIDADYSQIELKLLAHFSADPKLVASFNSGLDIHTSTAAEVFDVPQSEVTPSMRRDAKAVNFGIVYGISNYGLSQNIHISPKQATEYIKRYFERFPSVKEYLDSLVENAKACGYATTMFGRRRSIPELTSSKYTLRKFGERAAMNAPLQGTAADIIKIAMVNVSKKLEPFKARIVLQVHDELIIDCPVEEAETVKTILKTEMENAVKLSVPLNVDVSVGKNWMECK